MVNRNINAPGSVHTRNSDVFRRLQLLEEQMARQGQIIAELQMSLENARRAYNQMAEVNARYLQIFDSAIDQVENRKIITVGG